MSYLIEPSRSDEPTVVVGHHGHVDGCEGWYQLGEHRNIGRLNARRYGAIAGRHATYDWTEPQGDPIPEPDSTVHWDFELYLMQRERETRRGHAS